MTETKLLYALAQHLRGAVKGLMLPCEPDDLSSASEQGQKWETWPTREVRVVEGFLEPKRSQAGDDFPCIVVRSDGGSCSEASTVVKVSIILCIYAPNGSPKEGDRIAKDLKTRIITSLLSLPAGVLDERYQLRETIDWTMSPEQPLPFFQLDIDTTWLVPTVIPFTDHEVYPGWRS